MKTRLVVCREVLGNRAVGSITVSALLRSVVEVNAYNRGSGSELTFHIIC